MSQLYSYLRKAYHGWFGHATLRDETARQLCLDFDRLIAFVRDGALCVNCGEKIVPVRKDVGDGR